MTRQLTDAGEHGRLQGHKGGIWQQLDLVQDGEDHVGPCLRVQEKNNLSYLTIIIKLIIIQELCTKCIPLTYMK